MKILSMRWPSFGRVWRPWHWQFAKNSVVSPLRICSWFSATLYDRVPAVIPCRVTTTSRQRVNWTR